LDYYEAMETYGRIGLVRSYGNLQSYSTSTNLWKLRLYTCFQFNTNMDGLKKAVAVANFLDTDELLKLLSAKVSSPPVSSVVLHLLTPFRV
jgi:hypothetical protein